MNEDVKRFLDSIKYKGSSFDDTELKKVIFYKSKDSYDVFLSCKKVKTKEEVDELFLAAKNKINGEKKCQIYLEYKKDLSDEEYAQEVFNDLIKNKPSLKGNKISLKDNNLTVNLLSEIVAKFFDTNKNKILNTYKAYGFGDINLNVIVDKDVLKETKKEIEDENNKEIDLKKKESPYVMGKHVKGEITKFIDVYGEALKSVFECYIFGIETLERTSKLGPVFINNIKVSDKTDSYLMKIVKYNKEENNRIMSRLKEGLWIRVFGDIKEDDYTKTYILTPKAIEIIPSKEKAITDDEKVKRVELHAHTMMSQMDGLTKLDLDAHTCELITRCIDMGYRGVAITDHNGCQAFPVCYELIKKYNKNIEDKSKAFKGLYGAELVLVEDMINIVTNSMDLPLKGTTFVVFDTETTGFNAAVGDQMIEIGAVKIIDGEIIDTFDEFINPGYHLPDHITAITEITDEMVKDADNEKEVTKRFLKWVGDNPMVAHNAKFDISFIKRAMQKYNLGEFNHTVIDTLELSRTLDSGFARHSLSAIVKRYNVDFDEKHHHRADYDAKATALVFDKMLKKLINQNIENINDIERLISKDEIYKFGKTYHVNLLCKDRVGLKNLFKLISLASTKYLYKTPRIPRSELSSLREGLLIGSGCYESEVFIEARSKDKDDLANIINFYDYIEVQPPECYDHLIQTSDFKNKEEVENHLKKIINATKQNGKIIVATGDVHHFDKEDKIFRKIIVNQKVPGGGLHPLNKKDIKEIPSMHFRTTKEMLDDFKFLDKDLAYEIVVTNTNKVFDMIENIEVILDTKGVPFSPRVRDENTKEFIDCQKVVTDLVYQTAKEWYGDVLPYNIEERISKELYGDIVYNYWHDKLLKGNPKLEEKELEKLIFNNIHETILSGYDKVYKITKEYVKENWDDKDGKLTDEILEKKIKKSLGGIIGGGFDAIYLISQRLVKNSNDAGFIVGSRGSVGSSFVAHLIGITEVNALPAHYRCLKCKYSSFEDEENIPYGQNYASGFDLPDKDCPVCGNPLKKDGQDMPFATFLGFNADKVPDIDLNFSDLNQADAHEYTKVLFGVDNVYRAGTITTVADRTAFGFVKGYLEDNGILGKQNIEIERLALGCTGVKRTTGQHPGGIVVIPDYKEVFDFTAFQYPADENKSSWRTTHFAYQSLEENLLKLDILGHSDPTQLRLIQELSNTNVLEVPMDDKKTMSIFSSTDALGVTTEEIMCPTGTLGIPEFGTNFTIGMVDEIKPTSFAELVKIAGLSHGTDVWRGNAQELIKNKIVPFKEVIGCRDDIMVYLIYKGLEPIKAFRIMEFVRRGKASKDQLTWEEHRKTMQDAGIEEWFIDSCEKIKYMFPKAHAAAYVMSAFRIAWYKVHMPACFYASWFSTKATDFDIVAMLGGYDQIKKRIIEIKNKGFEATNKEIGTLECLSVALEAAARKIKLAPIDLYQSKAKNFDIKDDFTLIPPFITIDGLGETVANNIVKEAKKQPFISIEDFQNRCRASQTLVDKMKDMGIFEGMPESSQLSLF